MCFLNSNSHVHLNLTAPTDFARLQEPSGVARGRRRGAAPGGELRRLHRLCQGTMEKSSQKQQN